MDLVKYFKDVEKKGLISQEVCKFAKGKPCCVGAHLAQGDFRAGKNRLAEMLRKKGFKDCNAVHVEVMLREAGVSCPWSILAEMAPKTK